MHAHSQTATTTFSMEETNIVYSVCLFADVDVSEMNLALVNYKYIYIRYIRVHVYFEFWCIFRGSCFWFFTQFTNCRYRNFDAKRQTHAHTHEIIIRQRQSLLCVLAVARRRHMRTNKRARARSSVCLAGIYGRPK